MRSSWCMWLSAVSCNINPFSQRSVSSIYPLKNEQRCPSRPVPEVLRLQMNSDFTIVQLKDRLSGCSDISSRCREYHPLNAFNSTAGVQCRISFWLRHVAFLRLPSTLLLFSSIVQCVHHVVCLQLWLYNKICDYFLNEKLPLCWNAQKRTHS